MTYRICNELSKKKKKKTRKNGASVVHFIKVHKEMTYWKRWVADCCCWCCCCCDAIFKRRDHILTMQTPKFYQTFSSFRLYFMGIRAHHYTTNVPVENANGFNFFVYLCWWAKLTAILNWTTFSHCNDDDDDGDGDVPSTSFTLARPKGQDTPHSMLNTSK